MTLKKASGKCGPSGPPGAVKSMAREKRRAERSIRMRLDKNPGIVYNKKKRKTKAMKPNIVIKKITAFFKRETVLCVAALLAVISVFLVPPSAKYMDYIDFRVLALLFCLMLVVAGLQDIGAFRSLGARLLGGVRNTRQLCLILVLLCFFTSMFITNDVALITFVPFAVMILEIAEQRQLLIPVTVLQTIAANLGSMLTPIGNPQNLYLYTAFSVPMTDFLGYMLPLALLALAVLVAFTFFQKKVPLSVMSPEESAPVPRLKLLLYLLLFAVCLCCVVRILSWQAMLAVLLVSVFFIEKNLFKRVDYLLLLTFVCFFVFIGNIKCLPAVSSLLRSLLKGRELLWGILSSQFISNVPAAILLSGFTENVRALLYGVNLGGLGTLIASLASVISYRAYSAGRDASRGAYLKTFTLYNIAFLLILAVAAALLLG